MVIDFHTNALPDELAGSYIRDLEEESGIKSKNNGTLAALLKGMSTNKVDYSVILPIARKPEYTNSINEWAFDTSRKYSQIIPFGTVHPKNEDFRRIMKEFKIRGIKGISFHPAKQGFNLGEENMLHISHAAAMENLIVVYSVGVSVTASPFESNVSSMKAIIKEIRGAQIVVAHMGGYEQWDDIEEMLCGEDIYLDISSANDFLERTQMKRIIKKHGHEKVLFGSGTPWGDIGDSLRYIRLLNFDKRVETAICSQNAASLLNIR